MDEHQLWEGLVKESANNTLCLLFNDTGGWGAHIHLRLMVPNLLKFIVYKNCLYGKTRTCIDKHNAL